MPASMVRPMPTTVFDLAMNAEPYDDSPQRDGNENSLEGERDRRRDIEMRRVLYESCQATEKGQHQRMHGIDIEERVEAILVEQRKVSPTPGRRREDARHRNKDGPSKEPADTKRSSAPRSPSIKAAPRNSGTRKTRILAMAVSNIASSTPPTGKLGEVDACPDERRRDAPVRSRQAPRQKDARDQHIYSSSLSAAASSNQRKMPPGIFEHHRLGAPW